MLKMVKKLFVRKSIKQTIFEEVVRGTLGVSFTLLSIFGTHKLNNYLTK